MSDDGIRELERKALSGDCAALNALKRVWLRANGHGEGLVYVRNDAEANAAVKAGRAITMRLCQGDLVLVKPNPDDDGDYWPFNGPWIGVLVSEDCDQAFVIDDLGAAVVDCDGTRAIDLGGETFTVLRRYGKEATS